MRWLRRETSPWDDLPSELGFLVMVGRDAELPLRDIFVRFRDLVSVDMDWTDLGRFASESVLHM